MRNSNSLTPVAHGEKIDLTTWGFGALESVAAAITLAATEAIRDTFEEDPPYIYFPIEWGDNDGINGPRIIDPATLYVSMPLGATEEHVIWSVSLESAVDSLIEINEAGRDGPLREEGSEAATKLAARLRELATKLDDAVKRK